MNHSSIDLHCHSLASDGSLSPSDLVARAAGNGVKLMSLTDHDTVAGQQEAKEAGSREGVAMVPGIELSCVWGNFTIHVLAYNFDLQSGLMQEIEVKQLESRQQRAILISEKLEKKGFSDLLEAAQLLSDSGIPGRPHFAQAMIDKGYVSDHGEAFKKYLGAGKVGDVKSFWPDLGDMVKAIVATGASAVVAHPRKYNMTLTKLRSMLVEFKEYGGDGIEVVTSGQKQGEIGMLSDLCQRMALKGSIGSDFHSPKYRWAELGRIPSLPKSVVPIWQDWEAFQALNC
jgi:predicted metal-dependent phosphoesterase TrpH